MPPALLAAIPAVIGAGTAIYSGSQQKKAANKALDAQTANNDKSLAAQAAALAKVEQLQTPFMQSGYTALDQLASEFGLGGQSGAAPAAAPSAAPSSIAKTPGGFAGTSPLATSPSSAAPTGRPNINGQLPQAPAPAQPNWADYGAANPDVAAGYQAYQAGNASGFGGANEGQNWGDWGYQPGLSQEQFYQQHYASTGQGEGRQAPQAPQAAQPAESATPAANPYAMPAYTTPTSQRPTEAAAQSFTRPDAQPAPSFTRPTAAPAPTFNRPDAGQAPAFSRPDQPVWKDPGPAPDAANFFSNFQADPGYQFRLNQGVNAANTGFAARGMLKSGAAAKGVMDYSSGLASQEYGNWFNRQNSLYNSALGQYNTDRNTNFNIFNTNRGVLNQNAETDYGLNTDAYRYNANRTDTNFNTDRAAGTDAYRFDANRNDANFNTDRAAGTDAYRYATDRTDANFENDRNTSLDEGYRQQNRRDNLFAEDRSYDTAIAQDRRNYDRSVATDARDYDTRRVDTRTENLFDLAQMGSSAAGSVGGASQAYANNSGNIFANQGDAASAAAEARGTANIGTANVFAGAAKDAFNAWNYSRSTPISPQTHLNIPRAPVTALPDYNSLTRLPAVF